MEKTKLNHFLQKLRTTTSVECTAGRGRHGRLVISNCRHCRSHVWCNAV